MGRKVIIDCDPGIDDALALSVALLEPEWDVVAVTAVEGNAAADQTTRNLLYTIDLLDPPRLPRIGNAVASRGPQSSDLIRFHGPDGLGGLGPTAGGLHQEHPSDKLICDLVRSAPEDLTIVTLGPLTNLARAFRRDPSLPSMISRLIIMGGSLDGIGNVTPVAEFNMHYDPDAAREVFRAGITKTLIPLDVTRRLVFSLDLLDYLPPRGTRLGDALHHLLSFTFRSHCQSLALEGFYLHDPVAILASIHPELIQTREYFGDVETRGELTLGATVFDRRTHTRSRPNMEVAVEIDETKTRDLLRRALRRIGQR